MVSPRREPLWVAQGIEIPAGELQVETSRAGGPGGQNVNKVETRVTLRFDVGASGAFDDAQRALVLGRLSSRLSANGEILLHASAQRTQGANLAEARERLAELLRAALRPKKRRRATRPTRASNERRLRGKRERGLRKRERSSGFD
jgi:ribosome-associated protein